MYACTVACVQQVCAATARCLQPELLRTMALATFNSDLVLDLTKGNDVTVKDVEKVGSWRRDEGRERCLLW